MKKSVIALIVVLLCVGFMASGCAAICYGERTSRPKEAQDGIDALMLVGDIFLTGLLGLIIDFATGAIYKTKPEYQDQYPMLPPMEEIKPIDEASS